VSVLWLLCELLCLVCVASESRVIGTNLKLVAEGKEPSMKVSKSQFSLSTIVVMMSSRGSVL